MKKETPKHAHVAPKKEKRSRNGGSHSRVTEEKDVFLDEFIPLRETKPAPEPQPKKKAKPAAKAEAVSRREKSRSGAALLVVAIVLLTMALAAAGAVVWGGQKIQNSGTILPHVTVGSIDVGGLTREQAEEKLQSQGWEQMDGGILTVTLPKDVMLKLDFKKAGMTLLCEDAAEAALAYGRGGSWIDSCITYLTNLITPYDASRAPRELDGEYIRSLIERGKTAFAMRAGDGGYVIDEEASTITYCKGAGELMLDEEGLFGAISNALTAREKELSFNGLTGTVTTPDFETMEKSMAVDTVDAYYDPATDTIIPEQEGIGFDAAKARKLWDAAGELENVTIPVTLYPAAVTKAELENMLFRDVLGEQETSFSGSTDNRISNLELLTTKLNGIVMMPGDEFSYNEALGERTKEAGFLPAAAYDNGEVVQQIGGGICQGSSTLYCAVLQSNLEVLDRTCHEFDPGYLPKGMDATVSWGRPDFRFKNNRDYPIRIEAVCDRETKTLTMRIYGTNVTGERIEVKSIFWYLYDEEYPEVMVGFGAATYKYHYDKNDNLLDKEYVDNSLYHLHKEDIKWPEGVHVDDEEETGGSGDSVTPDDGGTSGGDSGDAGDSSGDGPIIG